MCEKVEEARVQTRVCNRVEYTLLQLCWHTHAATIPDRHRAWWSRRLGPEERRTQSPGQETNKSQGTIQPVRFRGPSTLVRACPGIHWSETVLVRVMSCWVNDDSLDRVLKIR